MRWRELIEVARMERVAVIATAESFRATLAAVADSGVVEAERFTETLGPAGQTLQRAGHDGKVKPVLRKEPAPISEFETAGDLAALAGEAELEQVTAGAVRRGSVMAIAGWTPASALASLATRLGEHNGAIVRLPARGMQPPTLIRARGMTRSFQPLIDIYTTIPYNDINPSLFAGLAYVAMFGMMFADVGRGLVLLCFGLALVRGRPARLARYRRASPFIIGAGISSTLFGFAFGETFGPTHLVPTLWLVPLDHPTTLLAIAIGVGAGLLAASHLLATVNRWREGGAYRALLSTSGLAGSAIYVGLALIGLGWYIHLVGVLLAGSVVLVAGLVLGFGGRFLESGGRALGALQAGVELVDVVIRLGTNTISFARLAAFGLTDAALGSIIWTNTVGASHHGPLGWMAAGLLFAVGNTVTFALEGLVCGIQAMRLEYYELFSRVFLGEGRQFVPWHVPTVPSKEATCSTG